MFRRSDLRVMPGLLAVCAILMATPASRADESAAFLERHGLHDLLALHLEQRLDDAKTEERQELLERLASIYARLLESESDPARRGELERRGRHVLGMASGGGAVELRLALLRGSYRSAERIAENHRLRLTDEGEVDDAIALLADLLPRINQLRTQLQDEEDLLESRLSRADGAQSGMLAEETASVTRLLRQSMFLQAWSLYYMAFLADRPESARAAEPYFARLLESDGDYPHPQDVSIDLRGAEPFARAILGMALCKSLTSSTPTALAWLALLEHNSAFEPLRRELPAWRLEVLLARGDFNAALDEVNGWRRRGEPIPPAWLRLAAVHALAAEPNQRDATALARLAVTELAARAELKQILDLADRFGVDALGTSGFAFSYVSGILAYDKARTSHQGDEPTDDPAAVAQYDLAVDQLTAAIHAPDATQFPAAAAGCRRLVAWCRYFQGRFLEAQRAFEAALPHLSTDEAPEALWMAIVCLDEIERDAATQQKLTQLIDRFLAAYPTHEHAPKLIYRQAVDIEEPSPEAIDRLLALPPESEVYDDARRRAAQMLYALYRKADVANRVDLANDYLNVAVGLLAREERQLDPSDDLAVQRLLVRCRRILEVALTSGVDRLVAVSTALQAFADVAAIPGIDTSQFADEIDYRRLQERLALDDWDQASTLADAMWTRDPALTWTRLAQRAMFRAARPIALADRTSHIGERAALEAVIRYGRRLLSEHDDLAAALRSPTTLVQAATVADALFQRWQRSGAESDGGQALGLFDELLQARPRNGRFLRASAILSEQFGNLPHATDCWRRLVAGREVGSESWYEAKYHLLELLLRTDPQHARRVLDQHLLLNPEYGPDPWGPRIRLLDQQLRAGRDQDSRGESTERGGVVP